jgi:quercetin dioxygenase-like cupin family protein
MMVRDVDPQSLGRRVAVIAFTLVAGLGLGRGAPAQTTGNHGVKVAPVFSQKMPNVPGKTMTVVSVEYVPGGGSAPHHHPASGMVFAYVVAGSIRSQLEGEPAKVYRAGESWSEPPNAHHVVSENASATEPARLLAVIVADDGVALTTYDK